MGKGHDAHRKRALLIGINTYPNLAEQDQQGNIIKRRDLKGCVHDALVLREVLEDKFGFPKDNITLLTEEHATRDGILSALDALYEKTGQDDIVVVTYAGHGSRRPDQEGDEADGWDSTLVPYDSGRPYAYNPRPNRDITDDEIYLWLLKITRKTPHVTLIFDSCRSGTITRDDFGEEARWVEEDTRSAESPIAQADWPCLKGRIEGEDNGWLPGGERYVLMAACRDDEFAGEYRIPGGEDRHGLLTYFLAQELKGAQPGTTYRDVYERFVPNVLANKSTQHPQMEGTLDREIFGVRDLRPMNYVKVVERAGKTVRLAAGAAQGVTRGSVWTVYPKGTKEVTDETQALGRVRIKAVYAVASEGVIEGEETPQDAIEPACRAVETARAFGDLTLRARVPDAQTSLFADELKKSDSYGQLLSLVAADQDADACVYLIPSRREVKDGDPVPQLGALYADTWAAVGIDGKLLMPTYAVQDPDAINTVVDNLAKIARVRRLNQMVTHKRPNPLDGKVKMILKRRQADGSWVEAEKEKNGMPVFKDCDHLEITVLNEYEKPVYIYLLDLGLTYSVQQIFPPTGANEPLDPNRPFDIGQSLFGAERIPLFVPELFPFAEDPTDTIDEGVDTALLFVTLEEADFSSLMQEGITRDVRGDASELEQLLSMTLHGERTRDMEPPKPKPGAYWTAVKASFILQRA